MACCHWQAGGLGRVGSQMNFLDFLAACIIGAFLIAVAVRGKNGELVSLAKRDIGFVKWALALGILYYLYGIPSLKSTAGALILAGFAGFFLLNIDNITKSIQSVNSYVK
jgi:chromate transport protein ChrA